MHESETSAEVSRSEPPSSSAPEQEVPAIFRRLLVFFSDSKEELAAALPHPPHDLWHYTTAVPLISMIENRELWATNAVFMNDQTEISHAAWLLQRLVGEPDGGAADATHGATDAPADRVIRDVLLRLHDYIEIYVTCFCAVPDLLSQWRGYGSSGGYAIGFDSSSLPALGPRPLTLARVTYDPGEQERQLEKLLMSWRSLFQEVDLPQQPWEHVAAMLFAQTFALLAITFKSKAFAEEQEWRLFLVRTRLPQPLPDEPFTMHFTERNGLIIPYVRLTPPPHSLGPLPLPIIAVTVGPSRYPQLASAGVWHLLGRHGLATRVSIQTSTAPLRS
jgi:hypothetical protein